MSFYAYLLRCSDGSYYAGHTDNLEARMIAHQTGVLQVYTHTRRPVVLVWNEAFESREEAFLAERQIKGWSRAKKEALIRGDWARIVELSSIRAPRSSREAVTATTGAARPSRASGRAGLATNSALGAATSTNVMRSKPGA